MTEVLNALRMTNSRIQQIIRFIAGIVNCDTASGSLEKRTTLAVRQRTSTSRETMTGIPTRKSSFKLLNIRIPASPLIK